MVKKMTEQQKELRELYIHDAFFEKGHWSLTFRQSFLVLLGWLGVLFPFFWILLPLLWPEQAKSLGIATTKTEVSMFQTLGLFLGGAFLLIVLSFLLLTFKNNRRYRRYLQKQTLHDEKRLALRQKALEQYYEKRFGVAAIRESTCYYSVKEEQNIPTNGIPELYEKAVVKL